MLQYTRKGLHRIRIRLEPFASDLSRSVIRQKELYYRRIEHRLLQITSLNFRRGQEVLEGCSRGYECVKDGIDGRSILNDFCEMLPVATVKDESYFAPLIFYSPLSQDKLCLSTTWA